MHVDWTTLGIWFLAAIGFFAAGVVLVWVTGWGSSGTLVEFSIWLMTMWIFSTGIVRSVMAWNVSLCWLAGLVFIYPLTFALWLPIYVAYSVWFMWGKWKSWGEQQND